MKKPTKKRTKKVVKRTLKRRNPEHDLIESIERSLMQSAEKSAAWGTPNWQNWDNFRIMIVNRFEGEQPSKEEVRKFLKAVISIAESIQRDLDFGVY